MKFKVHLLNLGGKPMTKEYDLVDFEESGWLCCTRLQDKDCSENTREKRWYPPQTVLSVEEVA